MWSLWTLSPTFLPEACLPKNLGGGGGGGEYIHLNASFGADHIYAKEVWSFVFVFLVWI